MDDDLLLEPTKAYKKKYQKLHEENTIKYFDELAKKGNVETTAIKEISNPFNKLYLPIFEFNSSISLSLL